MSKLADTNAKIAGSVAGGFKKIEDGVTGGYKKIEDGVVGGYKKVETGAVALSARSVTNLWKSCSPARVRPWRRPESASRSRNERRAAPAPGAPAGLPGAVLQRRETA